MNSAIYVFSRDVQIGNRTYRQNVSVYADDPSVAEQVLSEHLVVGRSPAGQPQVDVAAAYGSDESWKTHTVELDRPKVVSALLTQ